MSDMCKQRRWVSFDMRERRGEAGLLELRKERAEGQCMRDKSGLRLVPSLSVCTRAFLGLGSWGKEPEDVLEKLIGF